MRPFIVLTSAALLTASAYSQVESAPVAQPSTSTQPTPPGPDAYFESAQAKVVGEGYKFTEGPTWVPDGSEAGGYFVFCDVPADVVLRWDGGEAKPAEFRKPSGRALGTTVGPEGDLYFCEVDGRRVTRVALKDGRPGDAVVLADAFDGKRLNATNDLVVASDGAVYFTDPAFFTPKDQLELDALAVYRIKNGVTTRLPGTYKAPNGVALSLDGRTLFVNDMGAGKVLTIELRTDGSFGTPAEFADLRAIAKAHAIAGPGNADGLRLDSEGRVYTTGPGGLMVLSPEGKLVGNLPGRGFSNLAFGGKDGRTLLITAGGNVLSIRTKHAGAAWKK